MPVWCNSTCMDEYGLSSARDYAQKVSGGHRDTARHAAPCMHANPRCSVHPHAMLQGFPCCTLARAARVDTLGSCSGWGRTRQDEGQGVAWWACAPLPGYTHAHGG